MNIKICLPPRKRPITLEDLPDMSALVPVGWWQEVVTGTMGDWSCGVHLYTPGEPCSYSAIRERTTDGWGEWRIGKDFSANLAKFEIEAPWTLEEVKGSTGEFRCVAFFGDGAGFEVENIAAFSSLFWSVESALEWESLTGAQRIVIFDRVNRRRVLEVTQ